MADMSGPPSSSQKLAYSTAALELGGVEAVVVGDSGKVIWRSEPFHLVADQLAQTSGVDLVALLLEAAPSSRLGEGAAPLSVVLPEGPPLVALFRRTAANETLFVMHKPLEEPHQAHDAIQHDSLPLDMVTGLPDRRSLETRLEQRFASPGPFALLFIDIDGFKQINDQHGHLAGDEALRELSARMRRAIREHDFIARFGGDEFLAIVEGVGDMETLQPLLERLNAEIESPLNVEGRALRVTASIGTALSAEGYASSQAMMRAADLGMYATRASRQLDQR